MWHAGLRYRKNVGEILGCPDFVSLGPRVAVFCDGDFWHGKDWLVRRQKLANGHNSKYWVAKILRNMERDRQVSCELQRNGWEVLRMWESDIRADLNGAVSTVEEALRRLSRTRQP